MGFFTPRTPQKSKSKSTKHKKSLKSYPREKPFNATNYNPCCPFHTNLYSSHSQDRDQDRNQDNPFMSGGLANLPFPEPTFNEPSFQSPRFGPLNPGSGIDRGIGARIGTGIGDFENRHHHHHSFFNNNGPNNEHFFSGPGPGQAATGTGSNSFYNNINDLTPDTFNFLDPNPYPSSYNPSSFPTPFPTPNFSPNSNPNLLYPPQTPFLSTDQHTSYYPPSQPPPPQHYHPNDKPNPKPKPPKEKTKSKKRESPHRHPHSQPQEQEQEKHFPNCPNAHTHAIITTKNPTPHQPQTLPIRTPRPYHYAFPYAETAYSGDDNTSAEEEMLLRGMEGMCIGEGDGLGTLGPGAGYMGCGRVSSGFGFGDAGVAGMGFPNGMGMGMIGDGGGHGQCGSLRL